MYNYTVSSRMLGGTPSPSWGVPSLFGTTAVNPLSSADSLLLDPAEEGSFESPGGLSPFLQTPAPVNLPNSFPGAFSNGASSSLGSIPGGFGLNSLSAAQSLLGSVQGDFNWTSSFTQGLANSGLPLGSGVSGQGGQTRSSGGDSPLTVQATELTSGGQQIPVRSIDIEQVGDIQNSIGQQFDTNWYNESLTLPTAQAQSDYYVSVDWQNGESYDSTVADPSGGRTVDVNQPN